MSMKKCLSIYCGTFLLTTVAVQGQPPQDVAVEFDGVGDGIELLDVVFPGSGTLVSNGTIEFWAKPELNKAYYWDAFYPMVAVANNESRERGGGIHIGIGGDGKWMVKMTGEEGGFLIDEEGIEPVEDGKWHHVVVAFYGEEPGFYINGEQRAAWKSIPWEWSPLNADLHLGSTPDRKMNWSGKLSDVRMWHGEVKQKAIRELMNQPLSGNEYGLQGYWPMNDGEGETIRNHTIQKQIGEFRGAPRWTLTRPFKAELPKGRIYIGELDSDSLTLGPVELREPRGEVSYQWFLDGRPIDGAEESSLTLSGIKAENTGIYHVEVDDARDVTPVRSRSVPVLKKVSPVDWTAISPDMVNDEDILMEGTHSFVYNLAHLHTIANAIRLEELYRGASEYHRLPVNRGRIMRSMEHSQAMIWYYTQERPWNPYYGDGALRKRIEAYLSFWADKVKSDGGRLEGHLATSGFGSSTIAEGLVMLEDGPPIDPDVHRRVREAMNLLIMEVLESWKGAWLWGKSFSNQYKSVFAAAMTYLSLYEDEEMARALERRMRQAEEAFYSPAGYPYEKGVCYSYYSVTLGRGLTPAWVYGRDRPLAEDNDARTFGDLLRKEYERGIEWMSYNAVLQPGGERFFIPGIFADRIKSFATFTVGQYDTPLAEAVPLGRAFCRSRKEAAREVETARETMEKEWGDPPSLSVSRWGYFRRQSPKHRSVSRRHPSREQRREAFELLPYIKSRRFVHQRVDRRERDVFTYIRRPSYYLIHSPRRVASIGLLWHPEHGTLVQSITDDDFMWATRSLEDNGFVNYQFNDSSYLIDGEVIKPQVGTKDLPDGRFEMSTSASGRDIERRLRFEDHRIEVNVNAAADRGPAGFVEQIPLLLAEDDELKVDEDQKRVALIRDRRAIMIIDFEHLRDIDILEGETVHGYRRKAVHAETEGPADYSLRFEPR